MERVRIHCKQLDIYKTEPPGRTPQLWALLATHIDAQPTLPDLPTIPTTTHNPTTVQYVARKHHGRHLPCAREVGEGMSPLPPLV
jgi:hypothetical protein